MNQTSLKNQIKELLQSVQIHFPQNGQKLIIYLLFYKRYCALVQHGYITNLSTNLIENDLTEISKNSKNGKHIFRTLLNFNNDLPQILAEELEKFVSSIKKEKNEDLTYNHVEGYNLKLERKFETVLYHFSNIDVSILDISIKDFGELFRGILLYIYINEFKEDKRFNEFLINISQLDSGRLFIKNPKLGNIILDTLPILEDNYSLFHLNKKDSFIARMNLIVNGFYSFNYSEENISTIIVDDKQFHNLDNRNLLSAINNELIKVNYSSQLLFILPVKRIQELEFDDNLLKKLASVIKFNKHQGILIFRKNWQEFEEDIAIIHRYFENEIQKDTLKLYQGFIQKEEIQEQNYFRVEKLRTIQKDNNKIDLNEKEPKSSLQSINESLEHLNSKIQEINNTELSKIIKSDIDDITKSLNGKVILSNFKDNLHWKNLFIFFRNELKNLKSDKIEIASNFQNLTLLDLKINPNLFRNLFQYIDYNLSEDNWCKVEFDNSKQKNKIQISLKASIDTLFDGYIEQLNFITEIHNGFIKRFKKKLQSNRLYKIVIIDIPYAKELKHQTIEKLVKNETTGVLEKKDIYLVSDEIGNENIIRGLNIQDIIDGDLSDDEAQIIQKLRFQSSLEIFLQKKSEATTKTTSFKVELPESNSMIDFIFQAIEKRNWSKLDDMNNNLITVSLKADLPPSPSKIVDFFNKFHDSKRLKFITHEYDVSYSEFNYKTFLIEVEEEFEKILLNTAVHPRLENLIRDFIFKSSDNRNTARIEIGWQDDVVKEWCKANAKRHPFHDTYLNENMLKTFKSKIKVVEPNLEHYLKESIKQKLGDLFIEKNITFSKRVRRAYFYTEVEQILSGIRYLFSPIKDRIFEYPYIEISAKNHYGEEPKLELIILHKGSFSEKKADKQILLNGDLSSAKSRFEGFCDWAIQSKFEDGFFRLNILSDKNIPEKIEINESEVKGFSHHLTFYV